MLVKRLIGALLLIGVTAISYAGDGTLPFSLEGTATGSGKEYNVSMELDRDSFVRQDQEAGSCNDGVFYDVGGQFHINDDLYSIKGVCFNKSSKVIRVIVLFRDFINIYGVLRSGGDGRVLEGFLNRQGNEYQLIMMENH